MQAGFWTDIHVQSN